MRELLKEYRNKINKKSVLYEMFELNTKASNIELLKENSSKMIKMCKSRFEEETRNNKKTIAVRIDFKLFIIYKHCKL